MGPHDRAGARPTSCLARAPSRILERRDGGHNFSRVFFTKTWGGLRTENAGIPRLARLTTGRRTRVLSTYRQLSTNGNNVLRPFVRGTGDWVPSDAQRVLGARPPRALLRTFGTRLPSSGASSGPRRSFGSAEEAGAAFCTHFRLRRGDRGSEGGVAIARFPAGDRCPARSGILVPPPRIYWRGVRDLLRRVTGSS